MELTEISEQRLRTIFKSFNRFMLLLWRLGLGSYGNGTEFGGSIMVIKHTGRKTGLTRYTPVNYAVVDGDIYCTAGFGSVCDWYSNLMAIPKVEIWLPDGRWAGVAEDVSDSEDRGALLRQVIIASGFAGPLFGADPKKLTDADFEKLMDNYRLIRIQRKGAITGPGGPGDLAWVWPLSTFILLLLWFRRRRGSTK
ncbi:MAG: nitroreductase family deazaflavin-dependent oxidoreductase [Chloroflexota bacterium]|nr:nitroreductase family deazaflavin-dependent oxidoreductase [Chloroflexota bacterium]